MGKDRVSGKQLLAGLIVLVLISLLAGVMTVGLLFASNSALYPPESVPCQHAQSFSLVNVRYDADNQVVSGVIVNEGAKPLDQVNITISHASTIQNETTVHGLSPSSFTVFNVTHHAANAPTTMVAQSNDCPAVAEHTNITLGK